MTASTEPMLQFFQYEHLSAPLQYVSRQFAQLADEIVTTLPRNPERTVALRKLLEAKDCAVRALIYEDPNPTMRSDPPPRKPPTVPNPSVGR